MRWRPLKQILQLRLRGLNPEELEEKDRRLFDMLEDFDGIMAVDSAAASVYSVGGRFT